ncbi:MAG TPA: hypothetical protein VIR01_01240 [Pyrinomonadaceae bacterium]
MQLEAAVRNYLRESSAESRSRAIATFAKEVDEFGHLVFRIVETLERYHEKNPVHDENNPKQVALALMRKGANTLMAGFEIAIGGYLWEPPILFRSALEGFSVAWDIVHNAERFDLWKSGKSFSSTDSISNLKKAIEPVGKMYGFLSNMHVHTGPLNSSPAMYVAGDEVRFQFFGLLSPGAEKIRTGEVLFALLAAHICLQLTELVFHNYAAELETIEKIPGTDTVKAVVSPRHQPFVQASMQYFKRKAEGKTL